MTELRRGLVLMGWAMCVAMFACGGDDDSCDVGDPGSCDDGRVCEAVQGGEPACFDPVLLSGNVFDLEDGAGIGGARVVAQDVNGAAVSSVVVTDADGNYDLPIPSTRAADGTPEALELTLRVDAAGYLSFPGGVRYALPIDTAAAVSTDDGYVVESALTDVGLLAVQVGAGEGSIYGTVDLPAAGLGVLVVAEDSSGTGHSALASRDGDYRIFNLPADSFTVTAYAQGYNYDPAAVDLGAGEEAEANFAVLDENPGSVSGTISIVETDGETTVILAVESTFSDTLERGQTVPGLRAPPPGEPPSITGGYTIEGVPAGRYVVLAAFENDGLVRDPDLSIGGTSLLRISVTAGQETVVDGFKINDALDVISPGADGAEAVSATPSFSWVDDSSEKAYKLQVFDAFGEEIWVHDMGEVTGEDPVVQYAGDPLEVGMYYQFRVTAYSDNPSKGTIPIAKTEDLKGVFWVQGD